MEDDLMRRYLRYACIVGNAIFLLLGFIAIHKLQRGNFSAFVSEKMAGDETFTPAMMRLAAQVPIIIMLLIVVLHSVNMYLLINLPKKKLLRAWWGSLNILPLLFSFLVLILSLGMIGTALSPVDVLCLISTPLMYSLTMYFLF